VIRCLDAQQFGVPSRGAAYVVGEGPHGLVEAGTPLAAEKLLDALDGLDVRFVFVTHIHLDHAGGAGAIAQAHPEAIVVVHPRGVRHLADPSRLIEGVRAASPDLYPLYGDPLPVAPDRLHEVEDGEEFHVGGGCIRAIHAPGHAPHHVCFFESTTQTLFTGDAAGNQGIPVDVPLTVPPRFDIEQSIRTLRRLRELAPKQLAYTHFGIATDNALNRLSDYERQIGDWFERIRDQMRAHSLREIESEILSAPAYASLDPIDRDALAMCIRGAVLSVQAEEI